MPLKHPLQRWTGMIVLMGLLAGCQWKGSGDQARSLPGGNHDDNSQAVWRAEAVGLRIFPSEGLTQKAEGPCLIARIEPYDAMGDAVKATGTYRFDLIADFHVGENGGVQLYSWTVPVGTLSEHKQRYDPITRSYRFELKLDAMPSLNQTYQLVVTYMDPAGNRLETKALVDGQGVRLAQ